MNQKALKTLEFDKIIHILTAHAASEGAKEMCRKLVPYDNINDVERAQRETADALRRVYRKGSVSFGGIRDIRCKCDAEQNLLRVEYVIIVKEW